MTRGPSQETGESPPPGPGHGTGPGHQGEGGATVAVPGGPGAGEGGTPGQDQGPGLAQTLRMDTGSTLEVGLYIHTYHIKFSILQFSSQIWTKNAESQTWSMFS